jgi:beta-galactosidase
MIRSDFLHWDDVSYQPGELKVVTYKNGKKWATDTVKTTGPATKLVLSPDHSTIKADGRDLSYVTVTIADQSGLLVPRSKNRVSFSITGPGEIIATDNGNAIDLESFQSKERNAFNGLALAIVRSAGQPGTIVVKAESPGLASSEAKIGSRSQ